MKLSTLGQQCSICHQSGSLLCPECQRYLRVYDGIVQTHDYPYLDGLVIGRYYDRLIKHLMYRLTYSKARSVVDVLGSKLAHLIYTTQLSDYIALHQGRVWVTSVPMHRWKRYVTRGYNQSQLLAQALASSLQLPYYDLLCKSRWTASQVKVKSGSDKFANVFGSFDVMIASKKLQSPKLIVLVDDVIVSGATMNECARVLCEQYPDAQIWGVCVSKIR